MLRLRTLDRCDLPVDITDLDSVKLVCAIFLPITFEYYNQGPAPHHLWEIFTLSARNVKKWREYFKASAFINYDGVGK